MLHPGVEEYVDEESEGGDCLGHVGLEEAKELVAEVFGVELDLADEFLHGGAELLDSVLGLVDDELLELGLADFLDVLLREGVEDLLGGSAVDAVGELAVGLVLDVVEDVAIEVEVKERLLVLVDERDLVDALAELVEGGVVLAALVDPEQEQAGDHQEVHRHVVLLDRVVEEELQRRHDVHAQEVLRQDYVRVRQVESQEDERGLVLVLLALVQNQRQSPRVVPALQAQVARQIQLVPVVERHVVVVLHLLQVDVLDSLLQNQRLQHIQHVPSVLEVFVDEESAEDGEHAEVEAEEEAQDDEVHDEVVFLLVLEDDVERVGALEGADDEDDGEEFELAHVLHELDVLVVRPDEVGDDVSPASEALSPQELDGFVLGATAVPLLKDERVLGPLDHLPQALPGHRLQFLHGDQPLVGLHREVEQGRVDVLVVQRRVDRAVHHLLDLLHLLGPRNIGLVDSATQRAHSQVLHVLVRNEEVKVELLDRVRERQQVRRKQYVRLQEDHARNGPVPVVDREHVLRRDHRQHVHQHHRNRDVKVDEVVRQHLDLLHEPPVLQVPDHSLQAQVEQLHGEDRERQSGIKKVQRQEDEERFQIH